MNTQKTVKKDLVFEFNLSDFEDKNISVALKDNFLVIVAYRQTEKNVERQGFFHDEKTERNFSYSTNLDGFRANDFKREFKNGKLTVTLFSK